MIYFVAYLFIEVMVSSAIAGTIGGLLTFIEIIVSAVVGMFLLQNFRFALFENLQALSQGKITQQEFSRMNLSMALGALLLIVPGFFTDIVGILLQFEFIAVLIANKFIKKDTNYNNTNQYTNKKGDEDVIDVEIIEHIDNTRK